MRIPLKPTKKTIGDFTIESQVQIPGSTSVILRAYDDKEMRRVNLRMLTHLTPEQRKAYLKKFARYRELNPHPSHLKCYDEIATVDGEVIAVALERYEEDLSSFINRRRQKDKFLTPCELASFVRMILAAIVNYPDDLVHTNICLPNILFSRNGQNQLVLKMGDLLDEAIHIEKADEGQDEKLMRHQRELKYEIYDLGVALCQLITLNPTQDIAVLLAGIEASRERYQMVAPVFDEVLKMIDPNPGNRPIPKNLQKNVSTISFLNAPPDVFNPSVVGEDFVPAGAADAIVKRAQGGDAESQYQLTLLLRERGHAAQARAWCGKAVEQGHARAKEILGLLEYKGEGATTKDLAKSEVLLRQAADAITIDAQSQELLSDLLWKAGKIDELTQPNMFLSADVEAELGMMFLSGRDGIPQDEKRAQQYLQRSADRGNAIAQLFLASLLTESGPTQWWLKSAIEKVDQYISQKKLRFVLAAVMACLKGKSGSSAIINSSELKASDFKATDVKASDVKASDVKAEDAKDADSKVVDAKANDAKAADAKAAEVKLGGAGAKEVVHFKLRGKEEVEVRPLHADVNEALKELLIRNYWPADQDYLQSIRGFCGDFNFNNTNYPLMMVVPHQKQVSVIEFFKKPENRGRAADLLLPWALSLACAIESLHNENLVHADISARTVLINDGQVPLLAVSDYLCFDQENLPVKVRRGADKRLSYHLPRGDKTISKTSDIFAFGLTLFQMATEGNHSLYDWTVGISNDAILRSYSEPTNYTEEFISANLPSFVSAELKELILKCVHLDPLMRPTAFDLVEKLGELTLTTVIHARPSHSTQIEKLYQMAFDIMDTNPKFAFALLRFAAAAGHKPSMLQTAEMLWLGEQVQADRVLAIELANRYFAFVAKSNGSDAIEEKYQTALAYLTNRGPIVELMNAYLPSQDVRNLIMDYVAFKRPSNSFALALLGESADKGHTLAQEKVAEMLRLGIGAPQDKGLAIQYLSKAVKAKPEYRERLVEMQIEYAQMLWSGTGVPQDKALAIEYFSKAAVTKPEYQERLDQMKAEYQREQAAQNAVKTSTPDVEQKHSTDAKELLAAENLRLAFQYFFGLDVDRNLDLSREFLVKASDQKEVKRQSLMELLDPHIAPSGVRGIIADYARDPVNPNTQLARAILLLSTNPLDEKCPLRFFVPGDDFQPPFIELETNVYHVPGRAFRASIVGRIAVLLCPNESTDLVAWLNRSAHAHPNVIGPIGMTAGVKATSSTGARDTLPIALVYAPVQAAPASREMIADPTTACSRLLPFLVGVAGGLAHLHRSNVVHGNPSLQYLLVGHDRLGLIAVGPPSCRCAMAPESLASGHFSSASDVFQFGQMIAHMLTGQEDGWLSQTEDMDSKTRLAQIGASANNGYMDIRSRIPAWVSQPLVDIMLRCLRLDRTQRPAMDAVATEIQTLRSTLATATIATVGPRPAQFWMHTSHICQELTADDPMLRDAGTFECLYGPRIRDRMRQNHNPSTSRCKSVVGKTPGVMHSKSFGTTTGPSSILAYPNLAASTRTIIEYKSKFFTQNVLSSWDGSEVLSRGIRHFPSYARGAMLLEDKSLTAIANRLDRPPQYPKDHQWCTGKADECKCERAARPKNPGIVTKIPTDLLRGVMSFLDFTDYGALARVCRITAKEAEANMLYWYSIIKEFGNQGQAYMPREELIEMGKSKEQKEREKEEMKVEFKKEKQKQEMADKQLEIFMKTKKPVLLDMMGAYLPSPDVRNLITEYLTPPGGIKLKPQLEKNYFDPLLCRWAKTIAIQQIYIRAYVDLQQETVDVLHIPDITREERKQILDKAHNDYKAKTHTCSCCNQPVPFNQHFADQRTKMVGGAFMACNDCLAHQVWTTDEATTLWGFTAKQLGKIPFWRFSTSKRFSTADLLDFRKKYPMLKKLKRPKKIDPELYNRVPDLPEYVRQYVIFNPPHPALQVKTATQPALDPLTAMSMQDFDMEAMFGDIKSAEKVEIQSGNSEAKSAENTQSKFIELSEASSVEPNALATKSADSKSECSPDTGHTRSGSGEIPGGVNGDKKARLSFSSEHSIEQPLSSSSVTEEKGLTVDLEALSATSSVIGTVVTSESTAGASTTALLSLGGSAAADSTISVGTTSLVNVVYTVFYQKKPKQLQRQLERQLAQDQAAAIGLELTS